MLRQKEFLFILFILLAISLLAFCSCSKPAPTATSAVPQNPTSTGVMTTAENTSTAPVSNNVQPREVAVGEEFPIILGEDPASGNLWEANFDTSYIEQVSTVYVPPVTAGTGGGERDFQFKALKKGINSIIMELKRTGDELPKDSQIHLLGIDQPLPRIIENGGPVSINANEEFTLSVEENPTGEKWEAAPDSAYLQLISSTHNQNTDAHTFQFKSLKQGVTGLVLVLNKSPEGTLLEIQVDTVNIGLPAK